MKIAYTVRCSFTDVEVAERWLAWLQDRHLQDVCDAGAESGDVVRLDGDGSEDGSTICEARYTFASRQAFSDYEKHHAPRLRQEGLELFPLSLGLSYSRSVGIIEGAAGG